MIITTTDIQNNFGKYLKLSELEDVVITRNGKKVARLAKYTEEDDKLNTVCESSATYAESANPMKVTYEQYLKITEESDNRYEYINGELYLLASPLYPHQKAIGDIFFAMSSWFKKKKCIPLMSPFDVTLFKSESNINVVQPDILVICDKASIDEKGKYQGTPTLVLEVLSDSTKSKDMIIKSDLYMNSGVKEYWIVNTSSKEVFVYNFINKKVDSMSHYGQNELAKSNAFPGLIVDLKEIFPTEEAI